jgi:hypothetical protein
MERAMSIQPSAERRSFSQAFISILGLLATVSMSPASAGIQSNTMDPAVEISEHGRHLRVTGPVACTAGQRAEIQVTLTQRATGAIATGKSHFICTGYLQQWEVHAVNQGREGFEAGAATAVAVGVTSDRDKRDDAHQWLVQVTLVH